jgi:hypothetical protein
MLTSGLELKVLESVVGSVSVDVVHAFVWPELSSDVLLHDEPVLKFVAIWGDVDEHVSIRSDGSPPCPLLVSVAAVVLVIAAWSAELLR